MSARRWAVVIAWCVLAGTVQGLLITEVQAANRWRPKPLAVAKVVGEPVVLLCSCTNIDCSSCNLCRCFLGDGGVKEIRP